ncbi:MAG: hypothetical protein QM817_00665 [Archangium sp.]
MSGNEQTFNDGPVVKSVAPRELVSVTSETGMLLLTQQPKIWAPEAAIAL